LGYVTADILESAMRQQSRKALAYLLEELHGLGSDLSVSTAMVDVSEDLIALADRSPDHKSAPCRRTLPARGGRLLRSLGGDGTTVGRSRGASSAGRGGLALS
jgi:phosphoenolpyruvate carboxylase